MQGEMRGRINNVMKLFVVTQGEYSGYHVEAIFTDKDNAQEFIDNAIDKESYGHETTQIEEFELDKPREDWVHTVLCIYKDGHSYFNDSLREHLKEGFNDYHKSAYRKDATGKEEIVATFKIKTDSIKRAVKIVNEKRAQILAASAWGNEELTRKVLGEKS